MHLVEQQEAVDLIASVFETVRDNTDLAFLGFVVYRNIRSGANTMTRAGLTSPGGGLIQNWPTWGPDDGEVIRGDKEGNSNVVQGKSPSNPPPSLPPPSLPPAAGL